jgi:hypothetical protein
MKMANEKRLIDANELKIRFDEKEYDDIELYGAHIIECFPSKDANKIVDEMPTVDAVEVVHGEWEKQQGIYSCSICGKACPYDVQADIIQYWTCNYCPNCGAKMDGDGNVDV